MFPNTCACNKNNNVPLNVFNKMNYTLQQSDWSNTDIKNGKFIKTTV